MHAETCQERIRRKPFPRQVDVTSRAWLDAGDQKRARVDGTISLGHNFVGDVNPRLLGPKLRQRFGYKKLRLKITASSSTEICHADTASAPAHSIH